MALIELSDAEREFLRKILNNPNLGFPLAEAKMAIAIDEAMANPAALTAEEVSLLYRERDEAKAKLKAIIDGRPTWVSYDPTAAGVSGTGGSGVQADPRQPPYQGNGNRHPQGFYIDIPGSGNGL